MSRPGIEQRTGAPSLRCAGVPCAAVPCTGVPCARVSCARVSCARVSCARVSCAAVPCAAVPCAGRPAQGARRTAYAALAAALGALGLLGAAEAHAAPAPPRAAVRLELVRGPGAEGCPDEAFLRAEVAQRLGADPFRDDAPRVLSVRIERSGPDLMASLALRDPQGQTEWADGFDTRHPCEELLAGVALAIVAQLLEAPEPAPRPLGHAPSPGEAAPHPAEPAPPSWAPPPPARRTAPEPPRRAERPRTTAGPDPAAQPRTPAGPDPGAPPQTAAKTAPAPPRRAPAPPRRAPAPPGQPRLEAGLGAALGLGITPGAAAGMTLSIGVRRSDWSFAVEGRGLVSLGTEVNDATIGTSAFTSAALACHRGQHLFGCGVATLGVVRFVPRAPWDVTSRDDALLGLGARLGGEWPLSDGWSAFGYTEVVGIVVDVVLRRRDDQREAPGAITWSSSPAGAALGLGIMTTY